MRTVCITQNCTLPHRTRQYVSTVLKPPQNEIGRAGLSPARPILREGENSFTALCGRRLYLATTQRQSAPPRRRQARRLLEPAREVALVRETTDARDLGQFLLATDQQP